MFFGREVGKLCLEQHQHQAGLEVARRLAELSQALQHLPESHTAGILQVLLKFAQISTVLHFALLSLVVLLGEHGGYFFLELGVVGVFHHIDHLAPCVPKSRVSIGLLLVLDVGSHDHTG